MKIVFFGTPRLAQIVLEKLIDSPFHPQLIVTAPDSKIGRGQRVRPSPVKETTLKHKIKILHPKNLSDESTNYELRTMNYELAILVAYGKIIPPDILSLPKYGFINVHPSILPKHRGPTPIQTALLEGQKKTGVTIIQLDKEIDHGPILAQKEITIANDDTHASLIEKLGLIGTDLLLEVLPDYLSGKLTPKPQDHKKATFTKKITKKDGLINPLNPPNLLTLNRMIRAFYPWPGTWCQLTLHGRRFTIKFLPDDPFLIQPEGKKPMSIEQFLNGYPEAKGLIEKLS